MHQLDVFLPQQTHSMTGEKLGRECFLRPRTLRDCRCNPKRPAARADRDSSSMQASSGSPGAVRKSPVTTARSGASPLAMADGAADLRRGHVAADVDVAQLRDAQTVEGGRQAAHRQVHAVNLVMQTLEGEAVRSGGEGDGAGHGRDRLHESAPREIYGRTRGLGGVLRAAPSFERNRSQAARRRGARKSQSIAATNCTAK